MTTDRPVTPAPAEAAETAADEGEGGFSDDALSADAEDGSAEDGSAEGGSEDGSPEDAFGEDSFAEDLAAEVIVQLSTAGATVAVAESLTGGLVCAALTDVPGASAVVRGGIVAYATDLKAELLGVSTILLGAAGPVHPVVASTMATAVKTRLGATYGLATTGVAGPDPQGSTPVGTVYIAIDGPDGSSVERHQLTGDRAEIRDASVAAALRLLLAEASPDAER